MCVTSIFFLLLVLSFFLTGAIKKNWQKGGTAQQLVPQNIDNLVLEDCNLIISMRLIFRVI